MRLHAELGEAPRSGAGLVSVSTTHTGWSELPEELRVDREEARFVRLQKGVGIAGKLQCQETAGRGYQVLFITLTYREADAWRADHVGRYINAVRNDYRRKTGDSLRYVWVGETQPERLERTGDAVIHYHVIFWVLRSYWMPKADKRGWWPHGMTKTERARLEGGSVVYLMGYIKKQKSKEGLPRGARIFGVGGLTPAGRCIRRWVHMPRFLQARYDCRAQVRRAAGGGWVDGDGVLWASEWGVSAFGNGYTRLLRLRTYPPTGIEPEGPFSFVRVGNAGV
jgi:hypothetical protein